MSVYKDKKGRWRFQAYVVIKGRVERPSGSAPKKQNTKAAAEVAERKAIHALETATPLAVATGKDVPTFEEWSEVYMTKRTLKQSESERDSKRQKLKSVLVPRFGKKHLDQIDQEAIDDFIKSLVDEELAPSTTNNYLTCLGTILRYGHKCGKFAVMPDIPLFDIEDQPIELYTDDELYAEMEKAQGDVMRTAALLLGFDAGLRAGEIRALHRSHVSNGWLTIYNSEYKKKLKTPKGKKSRVVPMTARLETAVAAALAVHDGPRVLIRMEAFGRHSKSVGTPWTKDFMVHHQPPKGWHALRHAFCTRLAVQGVPATQIQKLAGHKSLKTTMRYMHTVDEALKAAVQVLETGHRFVPPAPPPPAPPTPAPAPPPAAPAAAVIPMPQATPEKLPYKRLPSTQRPPINGVPYAEYQRQMMRKQREKKRLESEKGNAASTGIEAASFQDS
jgi:integrase